jgi:hypothetical protein
MAPLVITDSPTLPECGGSKWAVASLDDLAQLAALVLIGRAAHAEAVLEGAINPPARIAVATKARLIANLQPTDDANTWHRDGHLFEIICWIAARLNAGMGDVISPPHHSPTQQGLDSLRVSFDRLGRTITQVTVFEFKCTDHARDKFRDEIMRTFKGYHSGERDPELSQTAVALLASFNLTDAERIAIYDKLIQERPLVFQAALTVTSEAFDHARRLSLFNGFSALECHVDARLGDTFPLAEIRSWFAGFAEVVRAKIEKMDV